MPRDLVVLLAARPVRLERLLGGLDPLYRRHKLTGIAGARFGVVDWPRESPPKRRVGQGWLARPKRRPGGGAALPFEAWREPAKKPGALGRYLILAPVVVALCERIAYRHFARRHRLTPIAFLLLVFHSVVFTPPGCWTAPAGPVAALLMAGGVVAAVLSPSGQIGFTRRALGHVESLQRHAGRVLEVLCQLETPWAGHRSGQFVFATFHRDEGAPPFTVVSSGSGDGRLVLAIEEPGDSTRALPERLSAGDPVTIEGPYGGFGLEGPREHPARVTGGIGIPPFISRLQLLAQGGAGRRPEDLFFSTDEQPEPLMTLRHERAPASGVALHVVVPPRDGFPTIERIGQVVPVPAHAEFGFCGPNAFGDALRNGRDRRGLPSNCFHQEAFEMR